MSKALVCLSEPVLFYAQDACKDKPFNHKTSVETDSNKSKTEQKNSFVSDMLPQDENNYIKPHVSIDKNNSKHCFSRKREASNILMESVKRRENMQNMDLNSKVPFEFNVCTYNPISHCQFTTKPDVSRPFENDSKTLDRHLIEDSFNYSSSSTDSGIDSSKNSSPSHSVDNVSLDIEIAPNSMEIDESKKQSCKSNDVLNGLSSKSVAISEDLNDLNLEEEPSPSTCDAKSPLIQSLFKNFPPLLYFSNKNEIVVPLPADTLSLMKWKLSSITPVLIRETILKCGFHLVDADTTEDWLGTWGKHLKCLTFRKIKSFQKVNHYPGSFHLGRKDKLWNNIRKMQNKHGKEIFSFFPDTYVLPVDLKLLKKIWEEEADQCWIKKPCASARGTGVKIIHKWSQVPKKRPAVIQRYIRDPYLINGSKFDLRIYVLVPSFNPLRIYVFQDGLVRFASEKYSLSNKSFSNRFIHLTNYSINKKSSKYTSNEDENLCQGHKWSLKSFWSYMSDSGIDVDLIKATIVDMIIKTVVSSEGPICKLMKMHARCPYNCYELFGFDVMLDKELQPWLLEVNISPSLHTKSALDLNVKGPLVKDMLNIAGYEIPQKCHFNSKDTIHLSSEGNRHQPIIRLLSAEEKKKHSIFNTKYSRVRKNVLEDLTLDDLYCLMESEDEYNRCGSFVRVFPTNTSHKYFAYFDQTSYYNILLSAWEQTFHNERSNGIKYIQELFDKLLEKNINQKEIQAKESEADLTITVH